MCQYSSFRPLRGKTLRLMLCIVLLTLRISSLPYHLTSTFTQQCFLGPPPQSAGAHIFASEPTAGGADWKHLRVFSISTSALSSVTSVNQEQPPISLRSQCEPNCQALSLGVGEKKNPKVIFILIINKGASMTNAESRNEMSLPGFLDRTLGKRRSQVYVCQRGECVS